ncbi:MAG: TonB-dependent receptor, partial [Chryseobacterium sp.]|nr:TonB-dependent receptor [Chryseobacterium sp.]
MTTLQINTNQGRDVEFAALQMDLIYDKTWMFQLKHTAGFDHSFFNKFDFNSYYSVVDHSMGSPDRKMVSDVKSFTYGAKGELKKSWNSNVLYTGLDYKNESAENLRMVMPAMMTPRDGTSWQDSEIAQIGWFGEYQRLFSGGKFTASARVDYNYSDAKQPSKLFTNLYGDVSAEDLNHNLSVGYSKMLDANSQLALWLGRAQRSGSLTERYI